MSETPINLNRARKSRARAKDKARADENAARFGRTKGQKEAERTEGEKADRCLSDHQRET